MHEKRSSHSTLNKNYAFCNICRYVSDVFILGANWLMAPVGKRPDKWQLGLALMEYLGQNQKSLDKLKMWCTKLWIFLNKARISFTRNHLLFLMRRSWSSSRKFGHKNGQTDIINSFVSMYLKLVCTLLHTRVKSFWDSRGAAFVNNRQPP